MATDNDATASIYVRMPRGIAERVKTHQQYRGMVISKSATIAMLLVEAMDARDEQAKPRRNERRSR